MLKNLKYQNGEEIQPSLLVNGGSNYELLLEEAVNTQNSMMEYKDIQSKLDAKIQAMKSQLSTQQKVLYDLFHNSNKELERTQINNNNFFTIEDLKILETIRQESRQRQGSKINNHNQKILWKLM